MDEEERSMSVPTSIDEVAVSDAPKEVEVFPGRFERRYFLTGAVSSITAAALLSLFPNYVLSQQPEKPSLSAVQGQAWDDFLKLSIPVAQQLIANPGFSVDEYLYRIGSL